MRGLWSRQVLRAVLLGSGALVLGALAAWGFSRVLPGSAIDQMAFAILATPVFGFALGYLALACE